MWLYITYLSSIILVMWEIWVIWIVSAFCTWAEFRLLTYFSYLIMFESWLYSNVSDVICNRWTYCIVWPIETWHKYDWREATLPGKLACKVALKCRAKLEENEVDYYWNQSNIHMEILNKQAVIPGLHTQGSRENH